MADAEDNAKPAYDWPAILDEVCDWVAGGRTIRDYCRQDGKPGYVTVYQHLARDEEASERIVRARARGCEAIAEEVLDIADDSSGDSVTITDSEGNEQERCNTEFVQRSKLRIEARLRLMSKWNSGRYGDRQQVEHSGGVRLDVVTGVPEPSPEPSSD